MLPDEYQPVEELRSLLVLDSEEALLGSTLKGGLPIYERVKEIVKPEMFCNISYGYIWSAIEILSEQGLGVDTITVGDELERSGKMSSVSKGIRAGRAVLSDLRSMGDPRNVESYAENVQDYYVKKQILEFSPKIAMWAAHGRRADAIIKDVENYFGKIILYSSRATDHILDMSTLASRAYDETGQASRGEGKFIPTGLIDLDKMLSKGLRGGDLDIIAARPGQGKTGFLASCILNMAIRGTPSLFFSMEMGGTQIAHRLISQLSGIPVDRILAGDLMENEWPVYTDAVERFSALPITIVDMTTMPIGQVRQIARRQMLKSPYRLIAFDYIQLAAADKKNDRRDLDIGEVTRGLKSLARELDIPILAAAQLNRAGDQRSDKKPVLSDLRESGSIENDADIVMFIHCPDVTKKSRELIVAKHRNGRVGTVELVFRGELTKFENAVIKYGGNA